VGRAKSSLFGLAVLSGVVASSLVTAANAETASAVKGIAYTAVAALTTDYVFRGVSQSAGNSAAQGYIEASHNLLYLGGWASSVDFGKERTRAGNLQTAADLELSVYGGVRPEWKGISFDLSVAYYAYPDSLRNFDYVEFDADASYTVYDKLTLRGEVWWSPNESNTNSELGGVEFGASYALRQVWFVSPSIGALFGSQWGEGTDEDYSYWNAGLTFDMSKNPALSFDVRYWDTDLKDCVDAPAFQCGPRVVGSVTATF
jgi:uncharacterized protein (TIGR02001 family)